MYIPAHDPSKSSRQLILNNNNISTIQDRIIRSALWFNEKEYLMVLYDIGVKYSYMFMMDD